jgi:uncharacterized Zn finger protein
MNTLTIILTVLSSAAGIISGLVLYNLTGIREALNQQAADISGIKDRLSNCKIDCDRNTVSKEDWVREIGYSRQLQERQIREMAEIRASLNIIDKLPEIAGQIARNIASEIKRGG